MFIADLDGMSRDVVWMKLPVKKDVLSFYRGVFLVLCFLFSSWYRRAVASWNGGWKFDVACPLVMRWWKHFL